MAQRESAITVPSTYTCLQCGASSVWEGGRIPLVHCIHEEFLIQCDVCDLALASIRSADTHFASRGHEVQRQRQEASRLSQASTPPPTLSPALRRSVPNTSALSPTVTASHCSIMEPTVTTQQPMSISRETSTSAAPAIASTTQRALQLLGHATDHLYWLASVVARQPRLSHDMPAQEFVSRTLFSFLTTQPAWDNDFRRYLAYTFPDTLPNAQHLMVQDIVMVLLPVYES